MHTFEKIWRIDRVSFIWLTSLWLVKATDLCGSIVNFIGSFFWQEWKTNSTLTEFCKTRLKNNIVLEPQSIRYLHAHVRTPTYILKSFYRLKNHAHHLTPDLIHRLLFSDFYFSFFDHLHSNYFWPFV